MEGNSANRRVRGRNMGHSYCMIMSKRSLYQPAGQPEINQNNNNNNHSQDGQITQSNNDDNNNSHCGSWENLHPPEMNKKCQQVLSSQPEERIGLQTTKEKPRKSIINNNIHSISTCNQPQIIVPARKPNRQMELPPQPPRCKSVGLAISSGRLLLTAALLGILCGWWCLPLPVGAQYRPEWPSKSLQQEIFLLNLEDGYFGCQVNESQDFLQLFELSRLCDGQPQCYLGSDELAAPLKCTERDRCQPPAAPTNPLLAALGADMASSSAISGPKGGSGVGQMTTANSAEAVRCVNGVCLDGLCYCNDGFGGKACDIPDENECKFRPCDVFAHCTNTMGSYYCSCFPGYDGDGMHCQDINECEIPSLAALCSDNSECTNLPGHFVCKCKVGFQQTAGSQSALTGAPIGNQSVICTDIDECLDERSCGRGANCENLPGSFRCTCPPGFTGDPAIECIDTDECRTSPCGPGAQCTNVPGGYRCSCAAGFERSLPLPVNSSALSKLNDQSSIGCVDVDECVVGVAAGLNGNLTTGSGPLVQACGENAQCVNTPGGFFCQCPPNYTGNPKVACVDIDECSSQGCGPNADCVNLPGSFRCQCRLGYQGDAYSTRGCQDEDECSRPLPVCGQNAQCFNTPGSYQCTCLSGFVGDPKKRCDDLDECTSGSEPCGPGAECVNLAGGYRCQCPDKFAARSAPGLGCERAAVDVGCSQDADCTGHASCINGTCRCRLGFEARGLECVDLDECALATDNSTHLLDGICGTEASCINTQGSFRCQCKSGFEKVERRDPKSRCQDVDECSAKTGQQVCGTNARCFNKEGGFECRCPEGLLPVGNDPKLGCRSPCDGVSCGSHASCRPHGEEAACVCKQGFTFDPANIKLGCVDIDECDQALGPSGLCAANAVCTNLPGEHRCTCKPGFSGDGHRYCEDVNECAREFGPFGQCGELAVCNNTVGSFTCSCAPGFAGDPKTRCLDVDECAPDRQPVACGQGAQCTNLPGSFRCQCPAGTSGDPLERCVPDAPPCSQDSDCPNPLKCSQSAGRCECPFPQPAASPNAGQPSACVDPCERTECGSYASCQLSPAGDAQPVCVCDAGFMAHGDGRAGCVDVNECIQGVALTGMSPLSPLSSPQLGVAAHNGTQQGHPCGRNALCRNLPGTFDCVCPAGYAGNAYDACLPDTRSQQLTTPTINTVSPASSVKQPLPSQGGQQTNNPDNNNNNNNNNNRTSPPQFGNYQQEPRNGGCSEACPAHLACFDGICVRPNGCRDNLDCRPSAVCEQVNQEAGSQCLEACELLRCGPGARCSTNNHRATCWCSTATSGDPYDLTNGCQLSNSATSPPPKRPISANPFDLLTTQSPSTQTTGGVSTTSQQFINNNNNNKDISVTQAGVEGKNSQQQQQQSSSQFGSPFSQKPIQEGTPSFGTPTRPPTELNPASQQPPLPTTTTTTTTNLFQNKRRTTTPIPPPQRVTQLDEQQQLDLQQMSNKSLVSQSSFFKQLTCTSDQHCPGNLLCLGVAGLGSGPLPVSTATQRVCGCPGGFRREADYCYLARVNCSSPMSCKARELCLSPSNPSAGSGALHLEHTGVCICPRGYRLTSGNQACIDRNECDEGAPCALGAVCQNTIGSYECVCPPGTSGEPYTKTCEPIGSARKSCATNSECPADRECDQVARECVSPCYICGPRATCTVTNHAAICLCPPRYTGNAIDLVYGCQEPLPATTTIAPSSYSSMTTTTTTTTVTPPTQRSQPLGVATTTLLPLGPSATAATTTTSGHFELTTQSSLSSSSSGGANGVTVSSAGSTGIPTTGSSQSVEFRTIPPSELFVMCLADGIQVDMQLGGFDGIIYVKGHSQDPHCRKLVSSTTGPQEFVDFKVQFGHCDLAHRDGEAAFVLVIQKHPKLVTYRARAYHVKCVYNTGERTVSLGFNVSMITTSGTIANTGPPPTCLMSITSLEGREVTSAEIGQDLLLRVDVQPDSIYGGFARSCEAKTMDDQGEYQYEVTDSNGCATDPSIFSDWKYDVDGRHLMARFNAFKFPSSNNLRFQCNIRVCFGSCPPVNCNGLDAFGRRKRRRRRSLDGATAAAAAASNQTSLSRRNQTAVDLATNSRIYLDESELANSDDSTTTYQEEPEVIVGDPYKEGALREEIMVQSNAILTFDRKEAKLGQLAHQQPQTPAIDELDFVCLPRLGVVASLLLTSMLAMLALAVGSTCWCFARARGRDHFRRHHGHPGGGPLPHPSDFPNPLARSGSCSSSALIYGP